MPDGFGKALALKRWDELFAAVRPLLSEPPFPTSVISIMVQLVEEIIKAEDDRGDIARTERSALALEAQPYQDMIDRMLYRMAGLTDAEAAGLEERLKDML